MAESHEDDSFTVQPGSSKRATRADEAIEALTILHHPDINRVGERHLLVQLAGGPVCLSRREPLFHPPGKPNAGQPLADRGISRHPHELQRHVRGGVLLRASSTATPMSVDGTSLGDEGMLVDGACIERGVVLQIGKRVALLLHRVPPESAPPPRFDMIGDSPAIVRVRRLVEQLSGVDVPVLLVGESGSGKELVARALHGVSKRASKPFIAINIAALPTQLAASELFGRVRGAYTGADTAARGVFPSANGGTLLLDEIGDAPADVQLALLRVLETGELTPIGSSDVVEVDVRVIAATDADLDARLANGTFRGALYHRLGGCQIRIPPLRERRDDIARLFAHFLRLELDAIGEADRLELPSPQADPWVPADVVATMCRADWTGNVRELRNAVRQLVISNRGAAKFDPGAWTRPLPARTAPLDEPRRATDMTEDELVEALRGNAFRIAATAKALRISKNALLRRIERSDRVRRPKDLTATAIVRVRESCGGAIEAMAAELEVSVHGLKLRMSELGLV